MTDHCSEKGGSLLHRIPVGLLKREFPPHLVDEAVKHSRRGRQRRRALSPQLMAYFTMGMWLYPDHAYTEVARQLVEGFTWVQGVTASGSTWQAVTDGALSRARERLGPEPLRMLFTHSTSSAAAADGIWRGLRVVAIDAFRLEMPRTAANEAAFGEASHDALPHLQVTVIAECRSRRLLDASMDPLPPGAPAGPLHRAVLGPGTLTLGNCRPTDFDFLTAVASTGTDVLCGVPADQDLPTLEPLPDGTYLSSVRGLGSDGSMAVRVVDPGPGAADTLLCTTLLDCASAPAHELVRHYASRWRASQLTSAMRTARLPHRTVLRSRHPWGVEQEVWALLCAYQALSHVMVGAA